MKRWVSCLSRQRDTGTRGHRKEGPLPRVNVCVARGASSTSCEGRWGKPSKRSPSPSECFPVFSGLRSLRRVPTGSYVLRLTCADSEFLVVVSEGKLLQGGDPRLHSTRAGIYEAQSFFGLRSLRRVPTWASNDRELRHFTIVELMNLIE